MLKTLAHSNCNTINIQLRKYNRPKKKSDEQSVNSQRLTHAAIRRKQIKSAAEQEDKKVVPFNLNENNVKQNEAS